MLLVNADNFIKRLSVNQMESGKETGSRCGGSGVPDMYWDDDEMFVSWFYPDNQYDDLRAREKFLKKKSR